MYRLPFAVSLDKTPDLLKAVQDELRLDSSAAAIAERLTRSQLPPLATPQTLSYLFGISYSLLLSMSRNPERYYRTYRIRKTSRGYRNIEAPRRFLKLIQRWIHDYILSHTPLPASVHGFVSHRDVFSSVQPHLKSKNIMVIDIRDFFPSIGQRQVKKVFKDLGFPVRVTVMLTRLCTFQGRLPQGAPTSPALANIVFSRIDQQLMQLALEWGCNYTRYADDLVFSGNIMFTRYHTLQGTTLIRQAGFATNPRKTRIIGGGGRQMVAGLVANKEGLPPRITRMRWRATFHQASLHPAAFQGQGLRLMGIAAFVNRYDRLLGQRYKSIARCVHQLDSFD